MSAGSSNTTHCACAGTVRPRNPTAAAPSTFTLRRCIVVRLLMPIVSDDRRGATLRLPPVGTSTSVRTSSPASSCAELREEQKGGDGEREHHHEGSHTAGEVPPFDRHHEPVPTSTSCRLTVARTRRHGSSLAVGAGEASGYADRVG